MSKWFTRLIVLGAALDALGLAAAAMARDGLTPQQERMRSCNTRADQKQLKDGERRHFMSSCLKGGNGNGHALSAQQRKNQECNREARRRGLDGAARRGFMSECEKPERVKRETADGEKARGCNRRADQRRLDGEERRRYISACLDGAATGS